MWCYSLSGLVKTSPRIARIGSKSESNIFFSNPFKNVNIWQESEQNEDQYFIHKWVPPECMRLHIYYESQKESPNSMDEGNLWSTTNNIRHNFWPRRKLFLFLKSSSCFLLYIISSKLLEYLGCRGIFHSPWYWTCSMQPINLMSPYVMKSITRYLLSQNIQILRPKKTRNNKPTIKQMKHFICCWKYGINSSTKVPEYRGVSIVNTIPKEVMSNKVILINCEKIPRGTA